MMDKWNANTGNLFFASVNVEAGFKRISARNAALACGILGTILAAVGFVEYFGTFLQALGTLLPPIGGILIGHHLIGKGLFRLRPTSRSVSPIAVIASLSGMVVGAVAPFGIGSINAILATLIVYTTLAAVTRTQVPQQAN